MRIAKRSCKFDSITIRNALAASWHGPTGDSRPERSVKLFATLVCSPAGPAMPVVSLHGHVYGHVHGHVHGHLPEIAWARSRRVLAGWRCLRCLLGCSRRRRWSS
jgi:hypothetical protein